MLRLADSIHTEPILISHLVRIAIVNLALQPVWEGLAEHKWSDAQLVELDRELARLDFLSDYKLSMRGEMVLCQEGVIDYLRRHPEQLSNLSGPSEEGNASLPVAGQIICRLIPSGWFYQNQLRCCRFTVQQYLPLADLEHRIAPPVSLRHAEAALDLEFRHVGPYNRLEVMFLPGLGGAVRRFASGQNAVDMARVAIAPWSVTGLRTVNILNRPTPCHRNSSPQFRMTSSTASRCIIAALRMVNSFSTLSAGMKPTTAERLASKKTAWWTSTQGDWVWRYPAR